MSEIQRILVPVDFSECSMAALDYAVDMAKTLGARIHLLHAFQNPLYALPMAGYVGPTGDLVGELRKQLAAELDKSAARVSEAGVAVDSDLIEGVPYRAIVELADDQDMDLIVIGTHGRTGVTHLLVGSVTERVVRAAKCPVLTVRSET